MPSITDRCSYRLVGFYRAVLLADDCRYEPYKAYERHYAADYVWNNALHLLGYAYAEQAAFGRAVAEQSGEELDNMPEILPFLVVNSAPSPTDILPKVMILRWPFTQAMNGIKIWWARNLFCH